MKKTILLVLSAILLTACGGSSVDSQLKKIDKALANKDAKTLVKQWEKLLPVYEDAAKQEDVKTVYKIWSQVSTHSQEYFNFGGEEETFIMRNVFPVEGNFSYDLQLAILEQAYKMKDEKVIDKANHMAFNYLLTPDNDEGYVDAGFPDVDAVEKYIKLIQQYDADWSSRVYWDEEREYEISAPIITYMASNYPNTEFGKNASKLVRRYQRYKQQEQDMAALADLFSGGYSSSSATKERYYQCNFCGLLLKSAKWPNAARGVCHHGGYTSNHQFAELCEEGQYAYRCNRCGLQVTANRMPDTYSAKCGNAHHQWDRVY